MGNGAMPHRPKLPRPSSTLPTRPNAATQQPAGSLRSRGPVPDAAELTRMTRSGLSQWHQPIGSFGRGIGGARRIRSLPG